MTEERNHDADDAEVISDGEWAGQSGSAGPDDDDPQGMRGQLDDSMDGLEEGDDAGEASRGIPQNAETVSDDDAAPGADSDSDEAGSS
jgi:hypothetical protein